MNNRLISMSNRSFNLGLLLIVFVLLICCIFYQREYIFTKLLSLIHRNITNINTLTVVSCVAVVFSIFFFYEFIANLNFQVKSKDNLKLSKKELDKLYLEIPSRFVDSHAIQLVRNYSYELWKRGQFDDFKKCLNLQNDVLRYIVKMSQSDLTVTWEEERKYIIKILELAELCFDTRNFKVDLFDPLANYRFPSGLFVVPLLNAIDFAVRHEGSMLKFECFNVDNLWNCQITNYISPLDRSSLDYKYSCADYIKDRINAENWPIRFNEVRVDQGMIVIMVGKYVK